MSGPRDSRRARSIWWALLGAGITLLLLIGAISGGSEPSGGQAASAPGDAVAGEQTPTATATATATADPRKPVRAEARRLARAGRHAAAAAALAAAGLDREAARVRRSGARARYRSARRALAQGRFATAKRLATESRRLRKTESAATLIRTADTEIAKAEAAERERRRLARIARDQRTCTSSEKRVVRGGDGTPAGCATYAAELATRAAERAAQEQAEQCDPNYEGACLRPDSPDYDCAGGSGDGPDYTGPVRVVGDDPYGLDRDGDGYACEG